MKYRFNIYSDYIWPFCYICKGIVGQLKKKFDIEDEWLPLEIHPEAPKEGKVFSVSSIIINNKYVVVGAQPFEVFKEALLNIEK